MSKKDKGKPFPAKVGSSAKSKGASLPTQLDCQGAGNAVKGQDERQPQAPLTAFPARRACLRFFSLTRAVVVIDGMALRGDEKLDSRAWAPSMLKMLLGQFPRNCGILRSFFQGLKPEYS
jgi:hypothetical protein